MKLRPVWALWWLLISVTPLWAGSALLTWENPTLNDDGTPLTDLSHIEVFYGTSSGNYSHQVNAGLATSASITGLTDGLTWFFTVVAVDMSGNASAYSNEVSKAMPPGDMTSPSVAITSPTNGAMVPRGQVTVISAQASDDVGVVLVHFRVNGALKCTDSTAPYTCQWSVPSSPNKPYTLQSTASDQAGNVGTSASVAVRSQ